MYLYYKNAFGKIDKNGIVFKNNNKKQKITTSNLVKVRYVKKQKYQINLAVFLLSVFMIVFLQKSILSESIRFILQFFFLMVTVFSFYLKDFDYRFIIITKNYFTEVKVCKKMSPDAEKFAIQINKLIVQIQFNELFKNQEKKLSNIPNLENDLEFLNKISFASLY